MCGPQWFIALFALTCNIVKAWDIAVSTEKQIEFYTDGKRIESEPYHHITALAYDAVYNILLFVDTQKDNASIFSLNLESKKTQALVQKKTQEDIHDLAFDPITELLFWTESAHDRIYWKSLKSKDYPTGNILLNITEGHPKDIAIDSCRGYVYWSTHIFGGSTIERMKFDGSERRTLVNHIFKPAGLTIDQRTRKLYWVNDGEGQHYSIERSDLDGNNKEELLVGIEHEPRALTISKDFVYWTDHSHSSLYRIPKHSKVSEPTPITAVNKDVPFGVVAKYSIADQTEGIPECNGLRKLSESKNGIEQEFAVPESSGVFCLHGEKIGENTCNCTLGFTGERCEIDVCHQFCLQGSCSYTSAGKPQCSCPSGYFGERCEVNLCNGYCLNSGKCQIEDQKPHCNCGEAFEGDRCETKVVVTPSVVPIPAKTIESCNCTINETTIPDPKPVPENKQAITTASQEDMTASDEFVSTCVYGWDEFRDPAIIVLGVLCGLLSLACAVLITKILKLKKRPRIKKRIIVNKNVTPLTARPDQCEITIENCCNMNICETPCFEPRSTIRPSLLDSKPGKEEKKNLISNMEYPDDY